MYKFVNVMVGITRSKVIFIWVSFCNRKKGSNKGLFQTGKPQNVDSESVDGGVTELRLI